MANTTGALGSLGQHQSENPQHPTVPSIVMWQQEVI
jgi:hypothetical protein